MDVKTHWEKVYATKTPESVGWYRAHLETSLALIERAAEARSASIIDVGGGESTLVDDLLLRGYKNLTVLDVSQTAVESLKRDWAQPRSRCAGWSAISPKSSWMHMPTMSGMTARYSIFLRRKSNVLPTCGRLFTLSSQAAT